MIIDHAATSLAPGASGAAEIARDPRGEHGMMPAPAWLAWLALLA